MPPLSGGVRSRPRPRQAPRWPAPLEGVVCFTLKVRDTKEKSPLSKLEIVYQYRILSLGPHTFFLALMIKKDNNIKCHEVHIIKLPREPNLSMGP